MTKPTAAQLVQAFQSLTVQEQERFFRTVSTDMEFPYAVREASAKASEELRDYMEFHGVPEAA